VELFQLIRSDLQVLSLCTYFAQVADVLCQEDIPNPELLSLVLNCFHAVSKLGKTEVITKAVFEMRAAYLAGYTPDLTGCASCGSVDAGYFNVSEGHLECAMCSPGGSGLRIPVSPGVVDAMRYLCYCGPKQLFSFQVGEETARELSQITEVYLTTQLERGFSALDFYKTLLYES
jgi:DNA repair protein RecO (recombination protein O)